MYNQRLLRKTKQNSNRKRRKLKSGNRPNTKRDRRRKAAAKAKVDEAVNNAKASIDQATNNNGVDTAKSEGTDAINHVQPVVVKKDEAKVAINKAAEAKKRKTIKHLMRQMKRRQQQKLKLMKQ